MLGPHRPPHPPPLQRNAILNAFRRRADVCRLIEVFGSFLPSSTIQLEMMFMKQLCIKSSACQEGWNTHQLT